MVTYKECDFGTHRTYEEVFDSFLPKRVDFYEHPEKYDMEPFCIFGNLYYVGNEKVCMHLVDTGAGLILFDTGYSHGHFDHFGGVGFLTIYKEFCRKYGLPENKCELLKNTIEKLLKKEVDIVLGNHPNQNCTVEKRKYMIEHSNQNPFISKEAWKIFLKSLDKSRLDFEVKGY